MSGNNFSRWFDLLEHYTDWVINKTKLDVYRSQNIYIIVLRMHAGGLGTPIKRPCALFIWWQHWNLILSHFRNFYHAILAFDLFYLQVLQIVNTPERIWRRNKYIKIHWNFYKFPLSLCRNFSQSLVSMRPSRYYRMLLTRIVSISAFVAFATQINDPYPSWFRLSFRRYSIYPFLTVCWNAIFFAWLSSVLTGLHFSHLLSYKMNTKEEQFSEAHSNQSVSWRKKINFFLLLFHLCSVLRCIFALLCCILSAIKWALTCYSLVI